jgi:hypothetical protein
MRTDKRQPRTPRCAIIFALIACCLIIKDARAAPNEEHCDAPNKAGIKRCEGIFHGKRDPATTWHTVTYSSRKDIIDWEINFPRNGGDATYVFLLIGATISILSPELPRDNRLDFIKLLLANAAETNPKFIPLGHYDWTSSRTDTDFMIRASRKK